MPLLRLSRRAVEVASQQMGAASGFMEVFYPTLLAQHGLTIGVVPPERVGVVKFDYPWEGHGLTEQYPQIQAHHDGKWYHPVKHLGP